MSNHLRTRLFLIFTLLLLGLLLWSKWEEYLAPKPVVPVVQASSTVVNVEQAVPGASSSAEGLTQGFSPSTEALVSMKTNVLDLKIDLHDGNIVNAALLKYPETLGSSKPVELLYQSETGQYVASTGFLGLNNLTYSVLSQSTKPEETSVSLQTEKNGLKIIKTYTLKPDSYQVAVDYQIKNEGTSAWQGKLYGQLLRTPPDKHTNLYTQLATFTGVAISNQQTHYQSFSFSKISKAALASTGEAGWAAMVQHYFVSAWIPTGTGQNQFYAKDYGDKNYGTGVISPAVTVNPGDSVKLSGHFYIGPTLTHQLNATAPFLSLTIDYGWLWFIAKYLFIVLSFIDHLVGNWGWSIVIITLLIKVVFFPLSHKSYSSMAKMRLLQPKLKQLQEQHAGDRPALQKAMMALYAKEKVNPLGGCLPILIQIPIFIALYWMLMASVELRQAPFLGWIQDLSVHDPYYVLPVLTGALMLLQQILGPTPPDKAQRYVMMSMPVVFTVFMFNLPSGLGLYMVVNIGISIIQQWAIIQMTGNADAKKIKLFHRKS